MRRDADARQPRVCHRHPISLALPSIRLDTRDAARDLPARRYHVRRRLRIRTRTGASATRRAGPGRDVSLELLAIAACGDGSPELSVDSIYPVDPCSTIDVVQVATMASRDLWRVAMRADLD